MQQTVKIRRLFREWDQFPILSKAHALSVHNFKSPAPEFYELGLEGVHVHTAV